MTTTPPGWYDDGQGAVRWWDGGRWTEHVAAPAGGVTVDIDPLSRSAETAGSRMWILWVALGVVLVGILVAAALVLPLMLTAVVDSSEGTSAPSSSAQSEGAGELTAAAEKGAVDAVKLLDHAWQTADCDEYFAATTEEYRALTEMDACEDFYEQSRGFMESVVDFSSTVSEVKAVGSSVAVSTTDRYDAYWDKDGEPTEDLHPYTDRIEYLVIEVDGKWHVDNWFFD